MKHATVGLSHRGRAVRLPTTQPRSAQQRELLLPHHSVVPGKIERRRARLKKGVHSPKLVYSWASSARGFMPLSIISGLGFMPLSIISALPEAAPATCATCCAAGGPVHIWASPNNNCAWPREFASDPTPMRHFDFAAAMSLECFRFEKPSVSLFRLHDVYTTTEWKTNR